MTTALSTDTALMDREEVARPGSNDCLLANLDSLIAPKRGNWFDAARERTLNLLTYKRNWDGEGAERVEIRAAMLAIRVLRAVAEGGGPPPAIFATKSGGVALEWKLGMVSFDLEFDQSDTLLYYLDRSSKTEWEGRLEDAPRELLEPLQAL